MYSRICKATLLLWCFLFTLNSGFAAVNLQEGSPHETQAAGHEQTEHETAGEAFNPGDFIFDHIKDAHDWHVLTINHKHISIPLPVILYSKNKGLNVFMSGKFEHGHDAYKGFRLETSGENKGKIIDEEDGSLPLDLSITKNVAAMLFSLVLLFWIFLSVGAAYRKKTW